MFLFSSSQHLARPASRRMNIMDQNRHKKVRGKKNTSVGKILRQEGRFTISFLFPCSWRLFFPNEPFLGFAIKCIERKYGPVRKRAEEEGEREIGYLLSNKFKTRP